MDHVDAYPLQWPAGRPRTPRYRRQASKFARNSYHLAAELVRNEIRMLGGKHAVISTDLRLRQDGLPYAGQRMPDDPGVAVYFLYKNRQVCFACDRWQRIEENLRAIEKTIEALRGIERWGSGDMIDAAFQGFETLPPPPAERLWYEVLGVHANAPRDIVRAAYHAKRSEHHPDKGGDAERFQEVQRAWERYEREVRHA
jgi:hypothetical protein